MIKSNDIEIHWNKHKLKCTRHINILLQIKVYEGFSHLETGIEICVAPSSRKCKNVTPNIAWYAIRMQLDSRWDIRLTVRMNYNHIEVEIYFHFSKFILFTTQPIYTIIYSQPISETNNTILILFIFRNDLNSNKKFNTIAINSLTFNVKQTRNNPFCDVIYDIVKHCIPSMTGVKICLRTSFVLVILQHIFLVPVMSSVDISQFIPLLYSINFLTFV